MKTILIICFLLCSASMSLAEELQIEKFFNWPIIYEANFYRRISIVSRENPDRKAAVKNVTLVYAVNKGPRVENEYCLQVFFEENGHLRHFSRRQGGIFLEDERKDYSGGVEPIPQMEIFSHKNIDKGPE